MLLQFFDYRENRPFFFSSGITRFVFENNKYTRRGKNSNSNSFGEYRRNVNNKNMISDKSSRKFNWQKERFFVVFYYYLKINQG